MEPNRKELRNKNILVTGGSGFVGSHIVDRLSPDNNVTVLDNLASGSLSNLSKSINRITFVKGDVLDKVLLKQLVAKADFVFHLAANVGNIKSIEDPYLDMEVNVKGTLNLLEACLKSNVKRLVYSSSGAIFGEAKYLPVDENHPLNPESPYGVSKLTAEKYCFAYYKVHGIPTTSIRYFNIYGPRQGKSEYANVISIFINRIREGKPLTVFGDGKQTRDFVFVGDIVQANLLAAVQPAANGEIFNIGTGVGASLEELIVNLDKISGKKNSVIHAQPRAGEVKHSRANIEKARKLLGYSPTTTFEEGLRWTWEHPER